MGNDNFFDPYRIDTPELIIKPKFCQQHRLRKVLKSGGQRHYFSVPNSFVQSKMPFVQSKTRNCAVQKITRAQQSAVAEMGDRLATIGMGRKWGGAAVGAGSSLGPHLTQCGLGRGLPLYQVAF